MCQMYLFCFFWGSGALCCLFLPGEKSRELRPPCAPGRGTGEVAGIFSGLRALQCSPRWACLAPGNYLTRPAATSKAAL